MSNTKQNYTVSIPIAGRICIEVTAVSAKAAIEAAWAELNEGAANKPGADIEWEFFSKLVEGNVCHAPHTEVEVYKDER